MEDRIIPVEVKKGQRVKAQSMKMFAERYKSALSYRISGKNFGCANGVRSIPQSAIRAAADRSQSKFATTAAKSCQKQQHPVGDCTQHLLQHISASIDFVAIPST